MSCDANHSRARAHMPIDKILFKISDELNYIFRLSSLINIYAQVWQSVTCRNKFNELLQVYLKLLLLLLFLIYD